MVFVGEHSLKIVDKLRRERYCQIFKAFCKSGSPYPVWDISQLENLDSKLAKILAPLISQLAKSSKDCNLKAFCTALEQYAKRLSPIDKSTLYSASKPSSEAEPILPQGPDHCSLNLKIRSKISLYERLLQDKETAKTRVSDKRLRRIEDELYECTFHPRTLGQRKVLRTSS